MKKTIIHSPLHKRSVILCVGDWDTMINEMKKDFGNDKTLLQLEEEGAMGNAVTAIIGADVLMWFPKFKNNTEYLSRLAHECFHATMYLSTLIGIDYSPEGDEYFAYTIDFLMREILSVIK